MVACIPSSLVGSRYLMGIDQHGNDAAHSIGYYQLNG